MELRKGVKMQAGTGLVEEIWKSAKELDLQAVFAGIEKAKALLQEEDLGELYYLRAQIKLLILDPTMLRDLERATALRRPGQSYNSFFTVYEPAEANGFILFSPAKGSIIRFKAALYEAYGLFDSINREDTLIAKQVECEIHYFTAQFDWAIALAEKLYENHASNGRHAYAIWAAYVLLRCYLAMGMADEAEEFIMRIIRQVRDSNKNNCLKMYETIRSWLNLTTGWSGDTPRYHVTPSGAAFPALEDRIEAIEHGISALGQTELPFVELARQREKDIYTMREMYMGVFDAMSAFKGGDHGLADETIYGVYEKSCDSGIAMPFVEYGGQLAPVLGYLRQNSAERYPEKWLGHLEELAAQYERGLVRFRGEQ